MSEILWLEDERCRDPELVGGKAANLARLNGLHLVPPGFAITAMRASEGFSDELALAIRRAYRSIALRTGHARPRVAVRSSAIDEDGATASFAGQHDTYLNIQGEEQVLDAVARCCASARTETATAYREQRGMLSDDPAIAVLVQQLVQSDTSAVVFSANPINGRRDEVLINASWGLGESIVGGTVTPDSFIVRRPEFRIVERTTSMKDRMTVSAQDGTREVRVPRFMREQPSLTDSEVIDLARLAVKLEVATGAPADVECAIAYGEPYLLQCRPITTLS